MKILPTKNLFILLFVGVFLQPANTNIQKPEVANMSPYFNAFISENETCTPEY